MLHASVQRFDGIVIMQKILALFGHLNKAYMEQFASRNADLQRGHYRFWNWKKTTVERPRL